MEVGRSGQIIENPDAYHSAIRNRIRANKWATGRRALIAALAAEPELLAWLLGKLPDATKAYGPVPTFLVAAVEEWGGLLDGQLAKAREIFAERSGKNTERQARFAAEKANATPWTAGRQVIEGVVVSTRVEETWGTSYKAMVKTASGATAWVSTGSADVVKGDTIKGKWTVTVSDKDATFAFGARPHGIVVVEPNDAAMDDVAENTAGDDL